MIWFTCWVLLCVLGICIHWNDQTLRGLFLFAEENMWERNQQICVWLVTWAFSFYFKRDLWANIQAGFQRNNLEKCNTYISISLGQIHTLMHAHLWYRVREVDKDYNISYKSNWKIRNCKKKISIFVRSFRPMIFLSGLRVKTFRHVCNSRQIYNVDADFFYFAKQEPSLKLIMYNLKKKGNWGIKWEKSLFKYKDNSTNRLSSVISLL